MTDIMFGFTDFKEQDRFELWLASQPDYTSIQVSFRAAMRVLPLYWNWTLSSDFAKKYHLPVLRILYPLLIAEVISRAVDSTKSASLVGRAKIAMRSTDDDYGVVTSHWEAMSDLFETDDSTAFQTEAIVPLHHTRVALRALYKTDGYAGTSYLPYDDLNNIPPFIFQEDLQKIVSNGTLVDTPIWHDTNFDPSIINWASLEKILKQDSVDWSFWIRWYEAALNGKPLNFKFLEQIALIPSDDWEQGAAHVNGLIAEIEAGFEASQISTNYTKSIQQAVAQNKAGIAPQIEALTEILSAEIERLRGKNPADEIEQEENKRLRVIFEELQVSIVQLGALVPKNGEPSQYVAEEMDGLLKVYVGEFKKWPRENAADMVDSTVRVALVGMTAGVVTLFGVPALVGVVLGGVAFGGKKLAGAAKALKDSSSGGS